MNAEECSPCVRFAGISYGAALGIGSFIKNHTLYPVKGKRENNFMHDIRCFSESRIDFLLCCFRALYFLANSRPSGIWDLD